MIVAAIACLLGVLTAGLPVAGPSQLGIYVRNGNGYKLIPWDLTSEIGDSCSVGTYDIRYPPITNNINIENQPMIKNGCAGYALCEPGYYCSNNTRHACPAGTYTSEYGSIGCKICPAGHLCQERQRSIPPLYIGASTLADCRSANGSAVFCEEGAQKPTFIREGYFGLPEGNDLRYSSESVCPLGYYCTGGKRLPCPAGTFGNSLGLSTPECSGPCTDEQWCPERTSFPIFEQPRLDRACRVRDAAEIRYQVNRTVQLGGALEIPDNIAAQQLCPLGCYCSSDGVATPCPAGRAGELVGESRSECSSACEAGWYCPLGSLTRQAIRCGNSAVYCPTGSAAPLVIPSGFFGFGGEATHRTGILPCPKGYYCMQGGAIPCRAGRYAATTGAVSPLCEGYCAPGYVCPTGSVNDSMVACGGPDVICPTGSDRQLVVLPGFQSARLYFTRDYAEATARNAVFLAACAADGTKLAHINDSGEDEDEDVEPLDFVITQCPGIDDGTPLRISQICSCWQRLQRVANVLHAVFIYATITEDTRTIRDAVLPCGYGYSCVDGVRTPCPPGTYANSPTAAVCNTCPEGFYCPVGARDPVPCGSAAVYCPPGAPAPLAVPLGYYSVSNLVDPLATLGSADAYDYVDQSSKDLLGSVSVIPERRDAFADRRTHVLICPPGTYCERGIAHPCLPGHYAASPGNTQPQCSGTCSDGYYCVSGSVSPTQIQCGMPFLYCPRGSANPSLVQSGYYTAGGDIVGVSPHAVHASLICNLTYVDTLVGVQFVRAEYPNADCDMTNVNERIDPMTLVDPWKYPPVIDFQCFYTPKSLLLGPADKVTFNPFRACTGRSVGNTTTRSSQIQCPVGYFCKYGFIYECPPGKYGNRVGESSENCSGECEPGYFCPWGSVSAIARPCGGAHVYCPRASGFPSAVDLGYYSDPANPADKRARQLLCEPGSYCVEGIKYKCPSGRYNQISGSFSASSCIACPAGFYCPEEGQADPTAFPCGVFLGSSVFCPPGSSRPVTAAPGYYTTGGHEGLNPNGRNITRYAQTPCIPGHYCSGGILRQCPAGRFGNTTQLADEGCSGGCSPGYFCPPGSTTPKQYRCGDLYVMLGDLRALLSAGINQSDPANTLDPFNPALPMLTEQIQQLKNALFVRTMLPIGAGSGIGGLERSDVYASSPLLQPLPQGVHSVVAGASPCFPLNVTGITYAVSSIYVADDKQIYLSFTNTTARHLDSICDGLGYGVRVLQYPNNTVNSAGLLLVPASIPFESGVRLRLPGISFSIDSLATLGRYIFERGPSALYCPANTGLPQHVPNGYYSKRVAAYDAGDDPTAAAYNLTQDAIELIEPGYFAIGGIKYPCSAGYFGNVFGLSIHTCSGPCPAGYHCPLASPNPVVCPDNTYATGGAAVCNPCTVAWPPQPPPLVVDDWPSASAAQTAIDNSIPVPCKTARSCCYEAEVDMMPT